MGNPLGQALGNPRLTFRDFGGSSAPKGLTNLETSHSQGTSQHMYVVARPVLGSATGLWEFVVPDLRKTDQETCAEKCGGFVQPVVLRYPTKAL